MFIDFKNIDTQNKVLLTDSRFQSKADKTIFFAIDGERHNGHDFIKPLYEAGLKEFVVEKNALTPELKKLLENKDIKAYQVISSIAALHETAEIKRKSFNYPVVGITGSNGKTIVKEWLSSLLEKDFQVVKTPRSDNSLIGVPLSVWDMTAQHNLGIFEAGISSIGEMIQLENIIKPDIGIFTNIGSAHDGNFDSKRQKVREKLDLFIESKTLIFCRDHALVEDEIENYLLPLNPEIELISWSALSINRQEEGAVAEITLDDYTATLNLPFSDSASIENTIHCAYAGLYILQKYGKSTEDFFDRFRFLKPVKMRLELKEGKAGNYIIDDSYNNDLAGLKSALNFLNQTHTSQDKVLIFSDILQSGLGGTELRNELFDQIRPQQLKTFIGIGPQLYSYQPDWEETAIHLFKTTEEFLSSGLADTFSNSLILVKGARSFAFETIVERLSRNTHETALEVNLDAVTHNLNYYRAKAGKGTKIMAMVKAFAYGTGDEVAAWLQYHRVDYLAVAYPDGGIALRQNGITVPIMVMNAHPESYFKLFEYDLEPEIYNLKTLNAFITAYKKYNTEGKTGIHIKIDTGMHRLGFAKNEIQPLLDLLETNPHIKVNSIFSHLAGSPDKSFDDFTKTQIKEFQEIAQSITEKIGYKPLIHINNTAGIARFPKAQLDMVRLGIGLYGVNPLGEENNSLQTVATLKTIISQIKHLKKGDTVGYDRKGVIEKDSKVATIAIGYADGYSRAFGNGKASVFINGKRCPTIGNVCMDMTMIDVTGVACKEGDEVQVFGDEVSVYELAKIAETIPYEILTSVSLRPKRVYYRN